MAHTQTPASGGAPFPETGFPATESAGPSVGELVKDISTNLSTLVRSEVELAKAEVTGEVKKALNGAVFFAAALAVVLVALPFIFVTIAEVLIAIGLPRWLGYLVVTALFLVLAGLFGYLGYRKVRRIQAPRRTIDTVKGHRTLLQRGDSADADVPAGGNGVLPTATPAATANGAAGRHSAG